MSRIPCVFKWRHKSRGLSLRTEVRHSYKNLPVSESSNLHSGLSKKSNSTERQSQHRIVQKEEREKKSFLFECLDTQEQTTATTTTTTTLKHFAQFIQVNCIAMYDKLFLLF